MRDLLDNQNFPPATTLFLQDAMAQSASLVESGWIKLVRKEQDGQTRITALCPPGSLLGAETLIANQRHNVTAITLVNCQLYGIPIFVFLDWVRTDPIFSWQIHRLFSRRINFRDISSTQSNCIPPRLRLEQLLWQLLCAQNHTHAYPNSKWSEERCKLLVPLQRQELAQMISVTPEHLSRLLRIMETDGVLRRDNGWLIVPNPEGLWRSPEIQSLTCSNSMQSEAPDLPDILIA